MKRLFTLIIAICAVSISAAFGQVKCISSNMDFEMTYKRTFVSNNAVVVDFVITYNGNGNRYFEISEGNETYIYDDEGNVYRGTNIAGWEPANIIVNVGNTGKRGTELPSGVPVKVRITIKDVDEFATLFPKMDLSCYFGDGKGWHPISISNVPIPRN